MDIKFLVKLTSKAWALDILAALHQGAPARLATLLSATGAGRTALVQSLHHLLDLNLLEKNPGHGHPLRPEFRLTAKGKVVAAMASSIKILKPNAAEQRLLRRAWTVPILTVSQKPLYFSQIKNRLDSVTDRALSQSLKGLQAQNFVQRSVNVESHPPRPIYQAIDVGAHIARVINA